MKYLLVLLLLTPCVFAQETTLQSKSIDTIRRSYEEYSKFYFNLDPIETSENSIHIRLHHSCQIVDFYSKDGDNFEGFIFHKAIQYSNNKKSDQSIYFFEHLPIEPENAKKISQWLLEEQFVLPEDFEDKVLRYFHCDDIYFEFKSNDVYKKQFYHCPLRQNDSVELIKKVVYNYDSLCLILNLDTLSEQFRSKLPKGFSYSLRGYGAFYLFTDKQMEQWGNQDVII